MIVWGGSDPEGACGSDNAIHPCAKDGAAYNPVKDSWRKIAAAPIEGRTGAAAVWTGREMVVWGGQTQTRYDVDDGAAYDPRLNVWHKLAKSPLAARREAATVWTGSRVIIWGGTAGQGGGGFVDGATYDPVSDRWEKLPAAPLDKTGQSVQGVGPGRGGPVIWTGKEMIQWGGNGPARPGVKTNPGNGATWSPYDNGEAYNPSTHHWRVLSSAPFHDVENGYPGEDFAAFDRARMTVLRFISLGTAGKWQGQTAAFDPESSVWATLTSPPVDCCAADFNPLRAVWGANRLLVWVGARALVFTP